MATFTTGRTLAIYEGLLKPFELQMEQWSKVNGVVHDELYDSPSDEKLYAMLCYEGSPFTKDMQQSFEITSRKFNQQWNDVMDDANVLFDRLDELADFCGEIEESRKTLEKTDWSKVTAEKQAEVLDQVQASIDYANEQKRSLELKFHQISDSMEEIIFSLSSYKKQNKYCEDGVKTLIEEKRQNYKAFAKTIGERYGFERSKEQKTRLKARLMEWE
jgi:predicted Fe-S protein YdhL (DUF1289 family)